MGLHHITSPFNLMQPPAPIHELVMLALNLPDSGRLLYVCVCVCIYTSKYYSIGRANVTACGIVQGSFYNFTLFPTVTFERSCWADI